MIRIGIILITLLQVNGEENITDHLLRSSNEAQPTTAWPWPWRPEIHEWFGLMNHQYLNLSAEPPEIWEAIYLAYRLQPKETPYNISHVNFGWAYYYGISWHKAEEIYLAEYAGTNKTMFGCWPNAFGNVPPAVAEQYGRSLYLSCGIYDNPEDYYHLTRLDDLSYVYKTNKPLIDVYIGLAIIIFAAGIIGNTLIVASILRNKDMKTPTNYFLLSLAINDLFICAVFPFVQIHRQYLQPVMRPTVQGCIASYYFEGLFFFSSIFHLTTVSFERFFAICFPMKVKTICTTRRAKILIPVLWIVAAIVCIPRIFVQDEQILENGFQCIRKINYYMTHWIMVHQCLEMSLYVIPLLLIIHNYGRLSYTLISSMKKNAQLMEGNQNEDNNRANEDQRRRIKVVQMLVAIVIIFFICWSPRIFWEFMQAEDTHDGWRTKYDHLTFGQESTIRYVTYMVSYVNSIANAPVYFLTSNQFNKAFKRILTCGRLGKEERVTSMITQSSMAASTSFTEKPQVSSSTGGGAP